MFSSTFQSKFNFQGLFKTVLYIQVLFKSVQTLVAEPDIRFRADDIISEVCERVRTFEDR